MNADKPVHLLLSALESQVEQHIQLTIRTFQNLDEHVLLKPSQTGGWSIVQCLWHLNSYGHFYLPEIRKALTTASPKVDYKSGWLGAYFIRMMKPGKGKKKYKAFKDHVPPQQLNAFAVVAEFIEQQELLLGYLKQAYNTNLDKRLPISISNLITMKLGDVLQFVIAHDERHLQQAQRNIS
jgi:uncharacterized damage-inducible protein DinB